MKKQVLIIKSKNSDNISILSSEEIEISFIDENKIEAPNAAHFKFNEKDMKKLKEMYENYFA